MNAASAASRPARQPQVRMLAGALAAGLALTASSAAMAVQPAPQTGPAPAAVVRVVNPKRENLAKLMRPITVDFQEQRLEDVLTFLEEFSGADIEPRWADDRTPDGLDRDAVITLSVQNVSVLTVLERVLEQARGDFSDNTWQFTEWGAVELGPKEILNRRKRVEIYDINDLLLEVPDYDEVPEIDLQSVLQSGQGGGGGGQSPFQEEDEEEDREEQERRRQQRVEDLVDLLQSLVEPDQWIDNGGNGGSMRYYQGSLIVNAPDYMHRQLNGYPFWPSQQTTVSMVNGRRYVTLDMDTGTSAIDNIINVPVTGVVGGEPSGPPGGGGSTQPAPGKPGGGADGKPGSPKRPGK